MLTETSPMLTNPAARARSSATFMVVLRVAFVLALSSVGWGLAGDQAIVTGPLGGQGDLIVIGFTGVALMVIALDVFVPRKSLHIMSGLFFGLLVGMVISYGLSLIVDLLVEANIPGGQPSESDASLLSALKLALGVVCCYLSVSFILQTKDDVRFVIPYVEFAKEAKGARPMVLDTSVIIDGRIADIANCGVLNSELVVPRFVLQELQTIADSNDKLKRTRGRRGLDMLNKLQTNDRVDVSIMDVKADRSAPDAGVDEMLVDLSKQIDGRIVTNDYNLNKVAQLRGVTVININDLANALKPVVLPGEAMQIKVVKPGESDGQGVGYLEDGTMVVVEGGREHIGEAVEIVVTSVLQTSAGRMIFGRVEGWTGHDRRRSRT